VGVVVGAKGRIRGGRRAGKGAGPSRTGFHPSRPYKVLLAKGLLMKVRKVSPHNGMFALLFYVTVGSAFAADVSSRKDDLGTPIIDISGTIEKGDLNKIKKTSAKLVQSLRRLRKYNLEFSPKYAWGRNRRGDTNRKILFAKSWPKWTVTGQSSLLRAARMKGFSLNQKSRGNTGST